MPTKLSPHYTCLCQPGFTVSGEDGGKCTLVSSHREFLVFGQSKPGVIRGVDLNHGEQVGYTVIQF